MLHEASTTVCVPSSADAVIGAIHRVFTGDVAPKQPGLRFERRGNELLFQDLKVTAGEGAQAIELTLAGRLAARDLGNGTSILTATDIADLSAYPEAKVPYVASYVGQISLNDALQFEGHLLDLFGGDPQDGLVHEASGTVTMPYSADAVITTIHEALASLPQKFAGATVERQGNEIRFQGVTVAAGEGAQAMKLRVGGRVVARELEDGSCVLSMTDAVDLSGFGEQETRLAVSYAAQFALGDAVRFYELVHNKLGGQAVA